MGLIVVGLDGSPRAPAVLEAAVAIARHTGQKLVLLRTFAVPPELPPGVWRNEGTLVDNIRGHAKDYLNDFARGIAPEMLGEVRAELGVPWQTVCAVAKGMNAELIVVGSHGYGAIDRLLGTTAAKIVNHAECSVLVVRAPAKPEAKG
jgi:nucleotide-binding universal stress UspA family protein